MSECHLGHVNEAMKIMWFLRERRGKGEELRRGSPFKDIPKIKPTTKPALTIFSFNNTPNPNRERDERRRDELTDRRRAYNRQGEDDFRDERSRERIRER